MDLKNKKILITAGPTWVPMDNVRVISNIATGETGVLLAHDFIKQGANVTLVLGPVANNCISKKIRVVSFRFFDELRRIIKKEITAGKYDVVIHTAAVSDYEPAIRCDKKIKSGINGLKIVLKPTPKIIDCIKKIQPDVLLVGFKFEPNEGIKALFNEVRQLIKRSKLNLAVANTIRSHKYKAYILNKHKVLGPFSDKSRLVKSLVKEIGRY